MGVSYPGYYVLNEQELTAGIIPLLALRMVGTSNPLPIPVLSDLFSGPHRSPSLYTIVSGRFGSPADP